MILVAAPANDSLTQSVGLTAEGTARVGIGSLLAVAVLAQTEGNVARNLSRHAGCCCTPVQALENTVLCTVFARACTGAHGHLVSSFGGREHG